MAMSKPLVFISYSHYDEAEKDELLTHLGVLRPELIDLWNDNDLVAGDDWEDRIRKAIAEARVAILLVSANFLTSEFIRGEEVPRLLRRRKSEGLIVFPVIAKACAWTTVAWLRAMQVRPKFGNPVWRDQGIHVDEELAKIAEEVASIIRNASQPNKIEVPSSVTHFVARQPPNRVKVSVTSDTSKVLVVDDEPLFRRSVIDIFSDTDIAFHEAGSVREAKQLLDHDAGIRIILLDLELRGENGTKILDHINHRAGECRVIVITGHDELLPSREAGGYKVFQYLSKSERGMTIQSLRFAVEQARQDLEREKLAQINQQDKFDDVVLNKYPTPFAYIYQELKSDLSALETLARQRDIFKLLLNFSAIVLMCEYFGGNTRNEELEMQIRPNIIKPSAVNWLEIINSVIEARQNCQAPLFLERFFAFFTKSTAERLTSLVEVFDRYLSQTVKLPDYEYAQVIKNCETLLLPLLQDFRFIADFLLCFVSNIQKDGNYYDYRLQECTGSNPQLLFSRQSFNFLMNPGEMQLINLKSSQFRSLHPFIVLRHCGLCSQWEIFFYSEFKDKQLHYISYKTGHAISTELGLTEFRALMNLV